MSHGSNAISAARTGWIFGFASLLVCDKDLGKVVHGFAIEDTNFTLKWMRRSLASADRLTMNIATMRAV
jgi:hypothetical protein